MLNSDNENPLDETGTRCHSELPGRRTRKPDVPVVETTPVATRNDNMPKRNYPGQHAGPTRTAALTWEIHVSGSWHAEKVTSNGSPDNRLPTSVSPRSVRCLGITPLDVGKSPRKIAELNDDELPQHADTGTGLDVEIEKETVKIDF